MGEDDHGGGEAVAAGVGGLPDLVAGVCGHGEVDRHAESGAAAVAAAVGADEEEGFVMFVGGVALGVGAHFGYHGGQVHRGQVGELLQLKAVEGGDVLLGEADEEFDGGAVAGLAALYELEACAGRGGDGLLEVCFERVVELALFHGFCAPDTGVFEHKPDVCAVSGGTVDGFAGGL